MSGVTAAIAMTDDRPWRTTVARDSLAAPSSSKASLCPFTEWKASNESGPNASRASRANSETIPSIPGIGSSRVTSPRTKPTTAALLPIPSAMVSSNVNVSPGVRARLRIEYRRSAGRPICCSIVPLSITHPVTSAFPSPVRLI